MSPKKPKTKKRLRTSAIPLNFEDFTRRLDEADKREEEKRSQSEEFSFDLAHEKPHGTPDHSPQKAKRSETHPVSIVSYEEYMTGPPRRLFPGGRRKSRKSRKSRNSRYM